jgi:hypothetical protein
MKVLLKLLTTLVVLSSFYGCATSGPKYSELMPTIPTLPPDSGRIYIYRPSAFGAAVQPDVKLDGEVVGKAVSHGFFYVDKKPGTYEIITTTEVNRKLSLLLESGQTRYVRLNISIGFFLGHVYPELVESEIAENEIQDCHYIGPDMKSAK